MAVSQKLVALLGKLEADALADLSTLLIPALLEEIEALSPASAQAIEVVVFAALQPAAQAALASLVAKVPVVVVAPV